MKTLNVEEVAALLRIHPVTVRNHARDGKMPGLRIGHRWVFLEEELLAWWAELRRPRPVCPPKPIGRPRKRVV